MFLSSVNSTTSHPSQKPEAQACSSFSTPLIQAIIPHNTSVAKSCSIWHSKPASTHFLALNQAAIISCLDNNHWIDQWVSRFASVQHTEVGSESLLQGIFWPRNQTQVSHIAGGFFTAWATREAPELELLLSNAWGRLFTRCLSAQARPFVFCFMVLELEICKSHFPDCLATAFLFSSADGSPWQEIRRQRWEKELFCFPAPVRLHCSSCSSSLGFCHSVY